MLSTLSRQFDHQFTFPSPSLRLSATSREASRILKSRSWHKSSAQPSGFPRMVKKFFAKATNNASSRHYNNKIALTVQEPSVEKAETEATAGPSLHPPTEANNGSVTQDPTTNLIPSKTTAKKASLLSNSLEMNSKGARNISVSPRNSSNQSSHSSTNEYLARKKREAINRLMEALEEWIYKDPSFNCHAPGTTGSPSRPASDSGSSPSEGRAPPRLSAQKRSLRRDSFDGSDPGGDGNEEDKRGNKRSRVDPPNTPKLACPFFKQDPARYKDRGACTGPGWSSPARLKEHIYRSHRQPTHKCNRCYETFQSGGKLEEHQRAEVPCKISKPKPLEGITDDQYHQLRKKTVGAKTSAERWEEVYRIIFPNATVIPTPYYDYDDGKHPGGSDSEFDVRDELLTRVRTALEVRFDKFEDEARTELVGIVRDELGHIREEYFQRLKPMKSKATTDTLPTATDTVDFPTGATNLGGLDFDAFLQNFDESHPDYGGDLTLGGICEADCGFSSNLSDSAYWSGTADSPSSFTKQ